MDVDLDTCLVGHVHTSHPVTCSAAVISPSSESSWRVLSNLLSRTCVLVILLSLTTSDTYNVKEERFILAHSSVCSWLTPKKKQHGRRTVTHVTEARKQMDMKGTGEVDVPL